MKTCHITCSISLIFIIGMIYFSLSLDKCKISKNLITTLDDKQREMYKKISNERKNIYFTGYGLGLFISLASLLFMYYNKYQLSKLNSACLVGAITFITSYYYYILTPKSDFMVMHLETDEQKTAWLSMYKKMQYHYHLGMLLGIIGVMLLGSGFIPLFN